MFFLLGFLVFGIFFILIGFIMGYLAFMVETRDGYISVAQHIGIPTKIVTLGLFGAGAFCLVCSLVIGAFYGCAIATPEQVRRASMAPSRGLQQTGPHGKRVSQISSTFTNKQVQLRSIDNIHGH
jgi:hypothetical protein